MFKAIILTILIIFLAAVAGAQVNDTDSSTVGVTLTTRTMIDITPADFSWVGITPGSVGNNESEANNYYAIQIENIGSKNITHIWFNATFPSASPFAVGTAEETDAGNYVVLSENETSTDYYFINRVEYGEVSTIVYLTDPDGKMPVNASSYYHGRFRNASKEYFWMVDKKDGNCSENTFYIGDDPHTVLSTGSIDFSNCVAGLDNDPVGGPGGCRSGALQQNGAYGYADVNIGGQRYCVTVYEDCDMTVFAHWNRDYPFNKCSSNHTEYAWNTTDGSDGDGFLVPGESFSMGIKVHVPYGIYEGASTQGKITVLANSV